MSLAHSRNNACLLLCSSIDVHEYLSLMGAVYGNNVDQKLEGAFVRSFVIANNVDCDVSETRLRGPIAASFKLFDENKDGQLSREELEHMLTRTVPPPSPPM